MNIIRIRCREALSAFKGADVFTADDKIQIRMIPCGHFVVTVDGKSQLVPHSGVRVVDVEYTPLEYAKDAANAMAPTLHAEITKQGRAKKDPVPA